MLLLLFFDLTGNRWMQSGNHTCPVCRVAVSVNAPSTQSTVSQNSHGNTGNTTDYSASGDTENASVPSTRRAEHNVDGQDSSMIHPPIDATDGNLSPMISEGMIADLGMQSHVRQRQRREEA